MKKFFTLTLFFLFYNFNGFSQCTHYTEANSGLAGDVVTALAIAPNGNIWAGTSWSGISVFNGSTWVSYNEFNSDLPDDYILDIKFDGSGNAWVATGYGLAKFNGTSWTVYDSSNTIIPGRAITAIGIDPTNKIWIASRNNSFDDQNVVTFDGVSTWQALSTLPVNAQGDAMRGFAFEGGRTWIASEAGVLKYESNAYTFYPKASTGIWSTDALVVDPGGDVWFGGFHGLLKRTAIAWSFIDHVTAFGFAEHTPYNSLIPDGGHLWISYYSGIMKFNKSTQGYTLYTSDNSCLPVVTRFNEMVRDANGVFWIASLDGLIKFDASGTTGLSSNTIKEREISIFPNPASSNSRINIEVNNQALTEGVTYKVLDLTGKEVKDGYLDQGNSSVDISGLPSGNYFFKLIQNNSVSVKHFIVY